MFIIAEKSFQLEKAVAIVRYSPICTDENLTSPLEDARRLSIFFFSMLRDFWLASVSRLRIDERVQLAPLCLLIAHIETMD